MTRRWRARMCVACGVLLAIGDAGAVGLGSHTLLGHEDGNSPALATTAPITTATSGSMLVVFSAGYATNDLAPTDTRVNTWESLGAPVVYRGYDGAFDVKAYIARGASGGAAHSVTIVKNGVPAGEITVPFIEIRNAGVLQAVAQNYPPSGSTLTSGDVTTTGPATLVAFWWGDAGGLHHSAVPDNGFTIIENFVDLPPNSAVQCVVASKQVAAAGTYHVSWATSPAQGAPLWLFAFQSDGDVIFADGFDPSGAGATP